MALLNQIDILIDEYFFNGYIAGAMASPRYLDNFIEEDNHSPGFLTIGQKYSIAIGSTVVLPCKINETGKCIPFLHYTFHSLPTAKRECALFFVSFYDLFDDCLCIFLAYFAFIIEQTGHYVLAWKHGIAVLTAGDVKVTSNTRIRLMPPQGIIDTSARSHSNSYNLEIQNVRMSDAGDYACQIGSIVPKEIVHSLEVLGKF